MKNFVGPLTWAYVIIIGGLMITPGGIDPIVTNPALRVVIGGIGVVLGVLGFMSMRRVSAQRG